MCILEGQNQEQAGTQSFCGFIKSFNTRRGFGFVSCEETAQRFGRDVYLSKDEAVLLAEEPAVGLSKVASAVAHGQDKNKAPPPVQEGDFILFQVKLSTEGFPQAVQAQKIRRLRGFVRQAPSSTAEGIIVVSGDGSDRADVVPDAALAQLLGAEVALRQAECGQLQLHSGDEVAFCCVNTADADGKALQAQLLDLTYTARAAGSVLGCFSLSLPQLGEVDDGAPNMQLRGHALTHSVLLSDVPANLSVPDLMRLFGKLGASEATVSKAKGSAFVSFSGPESIAKFLAQSTHTISEGGITQLAHVGSCPYRNSGGDCACCSSKTSAHSRVGETAPPVATDSTQAATQPMRSSCIDMRSPDAGATLTPPILSTPGGQSRPINFGFFLDQEDSVNIGGLTGPSPEVPLIAPAAATPAWRCMHSNIVIPSASPEMFVAGQTSCGVCVQWPTVVHACAYVVEIVDQVNMVSQSFRITSPEGVPPALTNFQVDGIQPSAYVASVRCVAPCGCESAPSPWSFMCGVVGHPLAHSTPTGAPVMLHDMLPPACPPPPSTPPLFPPSVPGLAHALVSIPEDAMPGVEMYPEEEVLTLD